MEVMRKVVEVAPKVLGGCAEGGGGCNKGAKAVEVVRRR